MKPDAFPPTLPENRPFDVVGLGGNAVDRIVVVPHRPAPGEKLQASEWAAQGGGRAGTAMVAASRLGMRVRFLGGVGDDPEGRESIDSLLDEGIVLVGMKVRPGGLTQRAFILVDETTGERTIIWGRSDDIMLRPAEVDDALIRTGRLFYTDAQAPHTAAKAANVAHDSGMSVLADVEEVRPGMDEFLPLVDLLITNARFPEAATGADKLEESTRILEERTGGALVIVTLGSRGAVARIEDRLQHFPAYAVEVVDTTGAGDVFHGAFAATCCEGLELADAIDFSNAVAAMKCRRLGGRDGIPLGTDQVNRFRQETPHRESGGPWNGS